MPCAIIHSNVNIDQAKSDQLTSEISRVIAKCADKPEAYVMVGYQHVVSLAFGGSNQPAAFVELSSIGALDPDKNKTMSQQISQKFAELLSIDGSRVYVTFTEVKPSNWGFNGTTF
ncbi:putative macrophage migration inhibitory factor [Spironucleus salmonicida]|uniref:L-dopachrome isomerase n=1 Tax=Spironucleus salmonicida TaxID=348837 RepID=V6LFR2_9EUKA|nr:putative macrophage migration inhibitory factor [Spironucleus salmonicida]|eukprot:EST43337.1 Putative macrophage migration inhibitory factor [Spironucleus salmonicida]